MVVHTSNPSTWEVEAGVWMVQVSLGYIAKLKKKKVSLLVSSCSLNFCFWIVVFK
jgi:hypothetical protein